MDSPKNHDTEAQPQVVSKAPSNRSTGSFDLRAWAAKLTSFDSYESYEYFSETDAEGSDEQQSAGRNVGFRAVRRSKFRGKRKSIILCSIVILILIVIIVAISVTATSKENDKVANIEAGQPGMTPDSRKNLQERITEISLEGGNEFEDSNSYQSRALEYLKTVRDIDSHNDRQLTQKYSLACFFYATNGVENIYHDHPTGPTGWKTKTNWLVNPDECTWHGIQCAKGAIFSINLEKNNILGTVPREIGLLGPSITNLDLSDNGVSNTGSEMDWLAEMTSLRDLKLNDCNFDSDGLPTYLGQLTKLEYLDVSYTLMFGSFNGGEIFTSLTNLRTLELSGNMYEEAVPTEITNLPRLENLYIDNAHVVGDLSFIPAMPAILELWLDYNEGITGSIPEDIGNASTLKSFSVSDCGIGGGIPSTVGQLTAMVQMWLHENNLTGEIPSEIAALPNLKTLHLEGNLLEGVLSSDICTDTIESLGSDCLDKVFCTCCTCCESPCTEAGPPLSSVESIVRSVAINGGEEFEEEYSPQSKALKWVNLVYDPEGDGLDRIIQRYVLATIWYATYAVENVYTDLPTPKWTVTEGWLSTYDECDWYGVYCTDDGKVDRISLPYNGLSGRIPQEIKLLSDSLIHLDLSGNPVHNRDEELNWLEDLTQLTQLDVHFCNFEWEGIPPYLASLTNMEWLDISYTLFHGPIDGTTVFNNLNKLWLLEMGGNLYDSPLPSGLFSLPNLEYLYVEFTHLTGDLSFINSVTGLVELWLDDNKLTGSIPESIGDIVTLESVSLAQNQLEGVLPSSFGNLSDLKQMWLFGNDLSGSLPDEFSKLRKLQILHMEDNEFTGSIPGKVCLPFLTTFVADCISEVECSCCTNCY